MAVPCIVKKRLKDVRFEKFVVRKKELDADQRGHDAPDDEKQQPRANVHQPEFFVIHRVNQFLREAPKRSALFSYTNPSGVCTISPAGACWPAGRHSMPRSCRIYAGLIGIEPGLILPAGDEIRLAVKLRQPKAMNDVRRLKGQMGH